MSPPPWTPGEQREWLSGWLADYITQQVEGKLHLFWPAMFEAWFRKWPEHQRLGFPLPTDPAACALTDIELATLGAAIIAKRAVSFSLETICRY
jgi:hypothetical protein